MLKIQEIEEKLMKIDGAVFQDLCDAFIYYTDPLCDNIQRVGMQTGKQKTVKGTPDSYYTLQSGKYVLLEYTTQSPIPKQKLIDKIKADIDKCLDESKTGLQLHDIEKITYCMNCDLQPADHKELTDYAYEKNVRLEIKSLSTLTMGLLSKVSPLAKQFLDIAIDSGQILDSNSFIRSHDRTGYTTPLGNEFIGRTDELSNLRETVLASKVTVLTGAPGVGKTKLVLGFFEQIQKELLDYQIFCIDNKHVPIYDDLRTFLPPSGNFILLIDDANRQISNLKPILSLLKEDRTGELHIIITVRDYALEEIESFAREYSPSVIRIEKFTDEQLTALLGSPDFEIHNPRYTKRILEIADGNARLAIMTAKVAIEKQSLEALQDVTDLYDLYFGIAIPSEIFTNQTYLKTLGIVSFFHSVSKEDPLHYSKMLSDFEMDRHSFEESLIALENLELVESSPDLLTHRIADQVLGTYFFYLSFFKKPVLDFNTILTQYFLSHYSRIRDTIIPANNTFGYNNVYGKVDPYLVAYWKQISGNEETALKFLELFWLYKQDEALSFVSNKIHTMPAIAEHEFIYDEEKVNRDYSDKDKYLSLLLNFFYHPLGNLKDAFTLAAAYVSKKPDRYGQLVKLLKDTLSCHREDEPQGFYRQHEFINFLANDAEGVSAKLRIKLFYDVVPALMKTSFNIVTGARKRNSMAIYRYDLPLTGHVKDLRVLIWSLLNQWFADNSQSSVLFLHEFLKRTPDRVKEVYTFDRPYVIDIFKTHLNPTSFMHCYIVQEFITWFKRVKIEGDDYDELKTGYSNDAYKTYLKLSDDYIRGRNSGGTKLSYTEYQAHKEKEVRKAFSLQDKQNFLDFYGWYAEINETLILLKKNESLQYSLDIVLHQAFSMDRANLDYLRHIAATGNVTGYTPYRVLVGLSADIAGYREFFSFINNLSFKVKDLWLYNWYLCLPEDQVTADNSTGFLQMLEHSTNIFYLSYDRLAKFQKVKESFKKDLLEMVYSKNTTSPRLRFYEFFETHLEEFTEHWELVKKTYFQQQLTADHFDYDYEIFYKILSKDAGFLTDYIAHWSAGYTFSMREHEGISIAWKHPGADLMMEQAMDYLCENRSFSLRQDISNVLFKKLPAEKKQAAIYFLQRYLIKHRDDEGKVNSSFDCIRHCFPEALESILLSFLEIQSSFDIFSKIEWTTSFLLSNGTTSFGEVRAGQYSIILDILEKITVRSYRFTEHKSYLKEMILGEKKYAAHERKRRFIEQNW